MMLKGTVCPESSNPFYIVSYYINWTYSTYHKLFRFLSAHKTSKIYKHSDFAHLLFILLDPGAQQRVHVTGSSFGGSKMAAPAPQVRFLVRLELQYAGLCVLARKQV